MTGNFKRVFGERKPVIGMVHLGALPGSPLYDPAGGIAALVDAAAKDLAALQAAGFDAVMFGNENDRPYEFEVDRASTATLAYVIGRLQDEIAVPFGVNLLWDPLSSIGLAAATGADFVREIFTGSYASDMGPWAPDAGKGHCQTNLNRPAKGVGPRRSGRQLTPLGQRDRAVLLEDVAAIEVTVLIEMIMDRGVDGGKLLQSFYVPELRHRTLSSSERLM